MYSEIIIILFLAMLVIILYQGYNLIKSKSEQEKKIVELENNFSHKINDLANNFNLKLAEAKNDFNLMFNFHKNYFIEYAKTQNIKFDENNKVDDLRSSYLLLLFSTKVKNAISFVRIVIFRKIANTLLINIINKYKKTIRRTSNKYLDILKPKDNMKKFFIIYCPINSDTDGINSKMFNIIIDFLMYIHDYCSVKIHLNELEDKEIIKIIKKSSGNNFQDNGSSNKTNESTLSTEELIDFVFSPFDVEKETKNLIEKIKKKEKDENKEEMNINNENNGEKNINNNKEEMNINNEKKEEKNINNNKEEMNINNEKKEEKNINNNKEEIIKNLLDNLIEEEDIKDNKDINIQSENKVPNNVTEKIKKKEEEESSNQTAKKKGKKGKKTKQHQKKKKKIY